MRTSQPHTVPRKHVGHRLSSKKHPHPAQTRDEPPQQVTLVEDHSFGVSCDLPPAKCVVDMYLHQNFKSCLRDTQGAGHDLLAPGRKVRLTG